MYFYEIFEKKKYQELHKYPVNIWKATIPINHYLSGYAKHSALVTKLALWP